MTSKWIGIIASLMVVSVVLTAMPSEAALSKVNIQSVKWSPEEPRPGTIITFTISLYNEHTSELYLKWIGVHFDWQPKGTFVHQDYSTAPKTIAPFKTYQVALVVGIPADANYTVHPYTIRIDYEADSASYSEKSDEFYDFLLKKEDIPVNGETPVWQSPGFVAVVGIVALMVILVIFYSVQKQRRLAKEALKKKKEYRSALDAQEGPDDIDLAETVTKHRPAPRSAMAQHEAKKAALKEEKSIWEPSKEERVVGSGPDKDGQSLSRHSPGVLPPKTSVPGSMGGGHQPMPQQPPGAVAPMPQQPPPPPGTVTHMPQRPPQPMKQPPVPPPPSQLSQTVQQRPLPFAPKPLPPPPPPPPPSAPAKPPPLEPTRNQCPICGAITRSGDETCPRCGGSL